MKETVVSGIRPTGKLHLGNYFGAIASFIRMQNDYNCFFFIADIHSLTTHPVPKDLHSSVKQVLAEYIALGLDPNKCTLFVQSDVPQVTELYTYMNMNAYKGELERSVTFKEKVKSQPDNVNAGLLTYPVLMAADILIHRAQKVPVGKDQKQHLEMTRQFGNRFNRMYNVDYFPEPEAFSYNEELVKVPGLTGGGKMSKSNSEADAIFIADSQETNQKKIMRAKTDSGPIEKNQNKPQEIQNLFDLMKLVCSKKIIDQYENDYNNCEIKYGELKKALAIDMEIFLKPHREKISEILQNYKLIAEVAEIGAEKAKASANKTISEVREIIGFRKFY
ncbi:MAG: tryptophan--tRNA ligase [Bacteroidia bacterium]|nr:tryptophan--tRNA ligase [Bacteroidia bacterium]